MDIVYILLTLVALYAGVGVLVWVQTTRDYNDMTPEERFYYYDHEDYKISFAIGQLFDCIVAWPWVGREED